MILMEMKIMKVTMNNNTDHDAMVDYDRVKNNESDNE